MATTTIPWNDGSGDNIYLTYPSASGSQTVVVTSDANTGSVERTKVVTFSASANGQTVTKTLTLIQEKVAEQYIIFADPVVEQICATNWGDGVGLTPSQAAEVTNNDFGTTFRGNTSIVSFNELIYFTGLTSWGRNTFDGASSLVSLTFPPNLTYFNQYTFRNNQALQELTFTRSLSAGGNNLVNGMGSLTRINIPNIESWITNSWTGTSAPFSASPSSGLHVYINGQTSELTTVTVPSTVTTIPQHTFRKWTAITSITFPSTITSLGNYTCYQCSSLSQVVVKATTPPTLGTDVFRSNASGRKIYVPYSADHSVLANYKSSWSTYSSYIYELNPDGTIPT